MAQTKSKNRRQTNLTIYIVIWPRKQPLIDQQSSIQTDPQNHSQTQLQIHPQTAPKPTPKPTPKNTLKGELKPTPNLTL